MNFKLTKNERLHSKKLIKELFSKGSSFFLYPFKVYYFLADKDVSGSDVQVLFSVSKKKLKKAVDRNTVKRKLRNAYRLNKHILFNVKNSEMDKKIIVGFVYVSNDILNYTELEGKLIKSLQKLDSSVNNEKNDIK
jgi:ribonuclease P protein component